MKLEFEQADVREVLKALFKPLNLSFTVDNDVQGTITVNLVNVTFETALQNITRQVDSTYRIEGGVYRIIKKDERQKAVGAALPTILGRLKENADTPEGAAALANAVNKDHDGSVLDSLGSLFGGGDTSGVGGKIIGKVFGNDAPAAQQYVAQTGGIDISKAAGLLSTLAPMILGALGKAGKSSGGLQADGLSGMLGGLLGGGGAGGGGLSSLLGGLLGGGQSAASSAASAASGAASSASSAAGGMMGKVTGMLDQNKDGSITDDVKRMAGKGGMLQKLMGMLKKK